MPLDKELQRRFEQMEWIIHPDEPQPEDYRKHLTGVNGLDPMCPYDTPASPRKFKNITDVVNRKQYNACFPQSFGPVPKYFLEFGYVPYFCPTEDEDYAYGALTIAGMIELTANNEPWSLARDQDIDEIITIAEAYRDLIAKSVDPVHIDYTKKVNRFLDVMETGRKRMQKRTGKFTARVTNLVSLLKGMLNKNGGSSN